MTDKIDNAFTAGASSGVTPEPTYSGALSFARRKYSKNLAEAELAVTGVPFDTATTSRAGARFRAAGDSRGFHRGGVATKLAVGIRPL